MLVADKVTGNTKVHHCDWELKWLIYTKSYSAFSNEVQGVQDQQSSD